MRFSKPEESFEDALNEGAANHPEPRRDRDVFRRGPDEGQKSARREIIRASDSTATLGPLEHDPTAGFWAGRMVGMLGGQSNKHKVN